MQAWPPTAYELGLGCTQALVILDLMEHDLASSETCGIPASSNFDFNQSKPARGETTFYHADECFVFRSSWVGGRGWVGEDMVGGAGGGVIERGGRGGAGSTSTSKLYRIMVVVAVCTFSSGARCEKSTPSPSYIESSGTLPEWNLSDLYTSVESEALASDLREAKMLCQTFANDYKDKLQKIAERPDGANEIA